MANRKRKQDGPTGTERQEAIVELIRSVPEGFVTTYGDLCPEATGAYAPLPANASGCRA
jgi:alkylated DNA nucleotide flippase Atl1